LHDEIAEEVMDLRLDGHTALVTGANGGLGSHFVEVLASAGADVAIAARRLESLREVEQRIASSGARVRSIALDVTRRESVVQAWSRRPLRSARSPSSSTMPASR
jgi:NADP-dependent 3-hydroxy acid dehydrogenase YdfG